jgi:hypothetical protein
MNAKHAYFIISAFLLALASVRGDLERGDSRTAVIAELGEPDGLIASGDYEMLSYERGKVELRAGRVVEIDLISDAELALRRKAEKLRAEEEARQAEQARRLRIERGGKVKQQLMSSVDYAEASGSRKVQILRRFQERYPEVDISDLLEPALAAKRIEQAELAQRRRMEELERRVDEAESSAQQAQWRAEQAENTARNARLNSYYRQSAYPYYYERYYRPRGYGLSVGYESPGLDIHYNYGTRSRSRTYMVPAIKNRTDLHEVMPQRLKGTLGTTRFNDGL